MPYPLMQLPGWQQCPRGRNARQHQLLLLQRLLLLLPLHV